VKKILFATIAFCTLLLGADKIPVTRWLDPVCGQPITPGEYKARFAIPGFPTRLGNLIQQKCDENLVSIVVQTAIYVHLESEIIRFADDLESEGYSVRIDTMSSGTADDLKAYLTSLYPELVGVILVGNLPVKWFRIVEEWDEGYPVIEVFPCEYYLMDLDGIWVDDGFDGILDDHDEYYQSEADIWLGRIDASRLTYGDNIELMKNYFDKNHSYRTGEMPVWAAALSYEYKDWHPWFHEDFDEFEYADIMRDTLLFDAPDYLNRIRNQPYEFVSIMCHSSPWRHWMTNTLTFNNDLGLIPPNANFYHLFACSGARFVEQDDLATTYVFMGERALWSVGSTKTGSLYMMYALPTFLQDLQTKAVGENMRDILSEYGDWNREWHFGLAVIGDPTLRLIYESRGVVSVDTVHYSPDGSPLTHDGTAADVQFLTSEDGDVFVYVMHGGNVYWNLMEFTFDGTTMIVGSDCYNWILGTGEIVASRDIDFPVLIGEGDALIIGLIDEYELYAFLERGEGYHSHPFVLNTDSGVAVAYTHWEPSSPEPVCGLYMSFIDNEGYNLEPEYEVDISVNPHKKMYPCAVVDYSEIYHIFWTELQHDCAKICAARIVDDVASEPEVLFDGSMPTAIVSGDGVIWLFFRGVDGKLYGSFYDDERWAAPEEIFGSCKILQPQAIIDETGEPVVIFSAQHSLSNIEISAASRLGDNWINTRLTYCNGIDFNPDGIILPDGRLLMAWISGASGNMQARWDIFDLMDIQKQNVPQKAVAFTTTPSPFNEHLDISWNNGDSRKVVIRDISGRIIDELYGSGNVRWDASKASSGLFFIEIPEIGTRKVFHIR